MTSGIGHPPVALVTGGGRGIGRACAVALGEAGFDVAVGYLSNDDAARTVVAELENLGRSAVAIRADVRWEADVVGLVDAAVDRFGGLSVVVSNATGVAPGATMETMMAGTDSAFGPTVGTGSDSFVEAFRGRVLALHTLARAAVPHMRDGGSIVAITSVGTRTYYPGYAPTAAAMAGAESLVRYLAVELGPRGITVNVVAGGLIATEALRFITRDVDRLIERTSARMPCRRVGTPSDIADTVCYLASGRARWITGQVVVVDGGATVV